MIKTGTSTVNPDITNNFATEVDNFIKAVVRHVSGATIGGSVVPMPNTNTSAILDKYITLAVSDLGKYGVGRVRAKSISKHTLTKILDEKMEKVTF